MKVNVFKKYNKINHNYFIKFSNDDFLKEYLKFKKK